MATKKRTPRVSRKSYACRYAKKFVVRNPHEMVVGTYRTITQARKSARDLAGRDGTSGIYTRCSPGDKLELREICEWRSMKNGRMGAVCKKPGRRK